MADCIDCLVVVVARWIVAKRRKIPDLLLTTCVASF